MKPRRRIRSLKLIVVVSFFLLGCGGRFAEVEMDVVPLVEYDGWVEKGYCMGMDGSVSNVLVGGVMSSPVPLCKRGDIVMHTHPVWGERTANFVDFGVWEEYWKRYGNRMYGVSGNGWVKVYEVK